MTDSATALTSRPLFREGHNCWRTCHASYLAPVIDCANYYRALHEAICQAKHSIFLLGWDIDSRIELLRGKDVREGCPLTLFELLHWKTEQVPEIQIYLNRWNYSVFMAAERESFSEAKWKLSGSDNLHFIFDNALPLGASHHQKIVIIDDEIAFCGGMDVAIARWDDRAHHATNPEREDPDGSIKLGLNHHFDPYHDVQMLVAGEAARELARLARYRWHFGGGERAIPLRKDITPGQPLSWPGSIKPVMRNVCLAIALTLPRFQRQPLLRQIEKLYLEMIAEAEQFIYIENQFFTWQPLAHALCARMRQKPGLRALLLAPYDGQGFMEKKSMYHGRVQFMDVIRAQGMENRVLLTCPVSCEGDEKVTVRIHSKLMVVDDRYLRIGSSNLNYRSMSLDSECDLVIYGDSTHERSQIAAMRDDLIREHTGFEIADIERIIQRGEPVQQFLQQLPHSRQHLQRIDDERYRHQSLTRFAKRFADSGKPLLPYFMTSRRSWHFKRMRISWKLVLLVAAVVALALAWKVTPLAEYASPEKVVPILEQVRNTSWALPAGILAYVLGTLLFFPHMVMTGTVVIVFAPLEAFAVAMLGSLISCSIGWAAGLGLGERTLRSLLGRYAGKISGYARQGGVMGLTLLRLLPIAPFTVVNLALGMMRVKFWHLLVATLLGLLPGTLVSVYIGKSAVDLFKHPEPGNLMMVGLGLLLWLGVVALTHFISRYWQQRHGKAGR